MAWHGSKGEPVTRWTAASLGARDSLLPVSREILPVLMLGAEPVDRGGPGGQRPKAGARSALSTRAAGREAAIHRRPLQLPERIYRESIGRWGVAIDRARGVVIDRRPGVAMVRGQLRLSTAARLVEQLFSSPQWLGALEHLAEGKGVVIDRTRHGSPWERRFTFPEGWRSTEQLDTPKPVTT